MRVVVVLTSLVLTLGARGALGQCDPTATAPPDGFARAIAALHAPRVAVHPAMAPHVAPRRTAAATRPRAVGTAPRRVRRVARPTERAAVRPHAIRVRRTVRRAAPAAVVRAAGATGTCRADDQIVRRLLGVVEPSAALADVMESPFGVAPAPSIASLPASAATPVVPTLTTVAGLGATPIGTLAGAGIGTTPGITAGIVLGAAVTAGAGTGIWKLLHQPASLPDGTTPTGGAPDGANPAPRPLAPPSFPLEPSAAGDDRPAAPVQPGGDAPATSTDSGRVTPGSPVPPPAETHPSGQPAGTTRPPFLPPASGALPPVPGGLPTGPAIPGLPFPTVPLDLPPAESGDGGPSGGGTVPTGPESGGPVGPTTPVPEPATASLLLVGAIALVGATRAYRRRER